MANVSGIPVWKEMGTTTIPQDVEIDHDVVIVGGGPVGLTLALDLGLKGRRVLLLSKYDFISAGSKAICFAKRTLDIWDRLGIGEAMVEKGVIWNIGKVFCGDSADPLYQFDLLPVKDQKNPAFINLQQYHAEEILAEAVSKLDNVDCRWGHEVTDLCVLDDSATLQVLCAEQSYKVEAQWVVACDGSKSSIREQMGLDFAGRVFEDNFLIADVKFKQQRPAERWFWFDPPFNRGQSALLHKQPDDIWRLDFQLGWDIDREACIKPENVAPFVRGMLGEDVEFEEEWYSVYTFQCRRMEQFVHGPVIFAGDSAHLVSPFGARGCNGGVADADNLGWKLDAVIAGTTSRLLIDSYNEEAIVTADENILNSTRSTDFMTPKSTVSKAFQDAVLELAADHDFARPFVNSGRLSMPASYPVSSLSSEDEDQWNGGIKPGMPAVDAPLGHSWLLQLFGDEFILLSQSANLDIPGIRTVELSDRGCGVQLAKQRYDLEEGSAYLIRPDQYVAARWRNPTNEKVEQALIKAGGGRVYAQA